ncbi:hypothetical protein B1H10_03580 [candidate division KSB1 bacterium 4484_188]|nr:MAG: hypothetical protein B1H10_03580 [candidate division KSB1 bacterium 4484_188]
MWIATAKRITIFDPGEKSFRNFTASDVFDNLEFQGGACKLHTGEVIFASTQGFIRFHPDSVKFGNYQPPVRITSFRVFNKEVPLERPIYQNPPLRLSYQDDFFSFEFSSPDFRNPAKNRYAYMMEGFDSDWIYSGTKNFVTYTNLDPGKYIFKVKGTNSDGVWNPNFTAVEIYISPPFWDTAWFKILVSVSLLLLLVVVYKWRTQRMKHEQRKLEKLVAEKTNQLKEKNLQLSEINENQGKLIEEREKLISELQEAMGKIKTLSGLLPICSHCKKVRDDSGYWKSIELYITEHSEADFSHGICPDCAKELYPDIYDKDDQNE